MAQGKLQRRVDADGVVWFDEPGRPRLRAALGLALVALTAVLGAWFLRPEPARDEPQDRTTQVPPAQEPPPTATPPGASGAPPPAPPPKATPPPAPPPQRDPLERAMLQALQERPLPAPDEDGGPQQEVFVEQLPRGDGTGLDAFPRPGEKPLKAGLIVPEGYPLPPGYVRHYQTTDDGAQLPAILMFHPDHPPPGVEIPADRVVPRALAPPGMPVEWLTPPPLRKDRK